MIKTLEMLVILHVVSESDLHVVLLRAWKECNLTNLIIPNATANKNHNSRLISALKCETTRMTRIRPTVTKYISFTFVLSFKTNVY